MIKTLGHIIFLRLIPRWILAVLLLLISASWLQSWHGSIATLLASFSTPPANSAIQYRLQAAENDTSSDIIRWPSGNQLALDEYRSGIRTDDFLDDQALGRSYLIMAEAFLGKNDELLENNSLFGIWRPVNHGYKQLTYRDFGVSFLDQILQRDFYSSQIEPNTASAGYLAVPVDIFGGLYLFTDHAPTPIQAEEAVADAIAVSRIDKTTRQFLAEVWAIDHQRWAFTPWQLMVFCGFIVAAPWLVMPLIEKTGLVSLLFLSTNVFLLVFLFFQWQWFYPVILPLLSTVMCWQWQRHQRERRNQITTLEAQQVAVTNLWVGHLLDESKPDAALRHLQDVQATKKQYNDIWQKVANGFERNRQFAKSIECYQSILASDAKHAVAKQKIKTLRSIVDGTKTMAIAQSSSELPVGKIDNLSLGRYLISRELGRGAMGIVYEAEDPKIHRKVALKVVHLKNLGVEEMEGVKQRFFREAQAAGKLNHPNIVTVFDVGEEHDVAYIAMDLLIGRPLSTMVSAKPINLVQVVRWVAQAAEALGYAHENDIIHRDVKPANMIIEEKSGRLKLTDFGVARIAGVQQTQTGIVLGSPSYMSPEQIRGEVLTGSTDIFSLGVTLYQCITGELPFVGDTLPALAFAITQSKQESPRNLNNDVSVSLVRIVNKALQKNPKDRFLSAQEFAISLNKWVNDNC